MREKAEQIAKNAEMKIQQAQIKEAKYQQNLEFQKKNNPNCRDYDENPLTIQSYEEFFILTMSMVSLIMSVMFFYICKDLYKGFSISISEYINGFVIMCLYILVVSIFQTKHFSKHKIKFTNRYIEFYDYGKLKRQCEVIKAELIRPFSERYSGKSFDIADIIIYILLIGLIIFSKGFAILIVIFFYISHLIFRFIFYIFLNRSFKGFLTFPFIKVADETFTAHGYGAVFSSRYFLVYLYNEKIYREVKQYFLQKNINIDNLPKRYSIF